MSYHIQLPVPFCLIFVSLECLSLWKFVWSPALEGSLTGHSLGFFYPGNPEAAVH